MASFSLHLVCQSFLEGQAEPSTTLPPVTKTPEKSVF